MGIRKFIAGVANVDMIVGNQIIASAKTLLDSSINISSSAEDVRGGIGNKLLGKYYHTSTMDITLTDVDFKLEYLAFQTGSVIEQIADIFVNEQVTINSNAGTLTGTPAEYEDYGTIAWVTLPGSDDYETVTVNGKNFEYEAANGTVVCVKYVKADNAARSITISSNFIPSEVKLVMTANLYRAGTSTALSDSSKVGTIQVIVPRFQFNGQQELSLTSSGYCQVPISGSALDNPTADCSEGGYYATIIETLDDAKWYDDVTTLAIEESDVDLTVGGTKKLVVRAVPKNRKPFVAPVEDLTFTSSSTSTATVTDAGLVTAVAAGTAYVTVVITEATDISAIAEVTVTNA